jgi:hypothetical protein
MSKRRAPPRPPAGGSEPPHDAAELRHLAACAWNFALTDRYRRTRDWRLFSFRREVERRRPLPFWYQANVTTCDAAAAHTTPSCAYD